MLNNDMLITFMLNDVLRPSGHRVQGKIFLRLLVKGYLLRLIVIAKNTRTKELVISYKKLYRSIGIKESGKGMSIEEQNKIHLGQMEIRKKVKKCLDFWREQGIIRRADTNSTKRAVIYV